MKLLSYLAICFVFAQSLSAREVITIWTSNENVNNAITKAVSQFEKEYNATVEVTVLNKNVTGKFKTAALTNKGPDILVWAHDVVGELAASGLIEPISPPPSLTKAFLPVALEAFRYKGKLYGYPYDLEAVALLYNKDLVKKVPSSLEELAAMAKKLNNPKTKTYGFLYDINNFFFSFPILTAGGAYIFKSNNGELDVYDIGLANDGAIRGAEYISKLITESIMPDSTDYGIADNKMKAGKLGMTINGPWALNDYRKRKINYGVAPIPSLNGQVARPFVGAHGFIIRRSSQNKELAKELVENYLVNKEGIRTLYEEDPRGPSRMDVIKDLADSDPDLLQFMKSAKNGIPMPNVPEMGSVWSAAGGALKLITTGKMSAKDALKQAKSQITSALPKKDK